MGYVFTSTKGCWLQLKLVLRIDFPNLILEGHLIQMFENVYHLRANKCKTSNNTATRTAITVFNFAQVCV